MKVMIFGAGGLVGKEFGRHLSTSIEVLPLTHSDIDITDSEAVTTVVLHENPTLIINCAALGVDACEGNPELAWCVNVSGTENLANMATMVKADFVQISSNYVFDGEKKQDSSYTCLDTTTPNTVYGKTKLASEYVARANAERCFIIRTSWVFGPSEKNFVSTVSRSLKSRKPVRAIRDIWASTTYVNDLVSRSLEIVSRGHYGTYHVVNRGVCSYYEFALETGHQLGIAQSELDALIEPIGVFELGLRARRPRYSPLMCLNSERLGLAPMREWHAALGEHIRLNETFSGFGRDAN